MKKTKNSAPENAQTIREETPNQKLSWFTSRNTIVGSAIVALIGLVGYGLRVLISGQEHRSEKKYDNNAEKEMINYRNRAELDLFREKLNLRAEYTRREREAKTEDDDEVEYSFHSPSDYLSEAYELRPMVGNMIPESFDALLYGMKGTMKSYLSMGTIIQMALGEKPRILSPRERDNFELPENLYCIYVDGENGGAVFKDRYGALGDRLNKKLEIVEAESFGQGHKAFFKCITNRCLLLPPGKQLLLCVDNIKSLLNDLSQNAGRSYLNELKKLRYTLKMRGISLTTITICHTEKSGEKIYGSYNLQCLAPIVIRIDEGYDYNHFVLTLENSRTDLTGQTRSLVVKKEVYKFLEYEDSEASKEDRDLEEARQEEARAIRTWLDEDSRRTQEDAAKHFGYKSRITIINRLKLLK